MSKAELTPELRFSMMGAELISRAQKMRVRGCTHDQYVQGLLIIQGMIKWEIQAATILANDPPREDLDG
jgi:hypothetical protein